MKQKEVLPAGSRTASSGLVLAYIKNLAPGLRRRSAGCALYSRGEETDTLTGQGGPLRRESVLRRIRVAPLTGSEMLISYQVASREGGFQRAHVRLITYMHVQGSVILGSFSV